jgi:hypothetical protein
MLCYDYIATVCRYLATAGLLGLLWLLPYVTSEINMCAAIWGNRVVETTSHSRIWSTSQPWIGAIRDIRGLLELVELLESLGLLGISEVYLSK